MANENKVILVTGANKGIGFEVSRQLAKQGCTVLMGARDPKLGEAAVNMLRAEGGDVCAIEIDLEKQPTIEAAAKHVEAEYGRLDVLVNNAGLVDRADGPPEAASLEAVRHVLDVNFLGSVAVTQAMLPLIRRSAGGRIVNVSSGLGSITLHGDPNWIHASVKPLGYAASKAALNMFTVQLAYQLRDTPIKVNSADPGYTATDLNGNRGTQTVEEGSEAAIKLALLPADGPTGGFFDRHGVAPW